MKSRVGLFMVLLIGTLSVTIESVKAYSLSAVVDEKCARIKIDCKSFGNVVRTCGSNGKQFVNSCALQLASCDFYFATGAVIKEVKCPPLDDKDEVEMDNERKDGHEKKKETGKGVSDPEETKEEEEEEANYEMSEETSTVREVVEQTTEGGTKEEEEEEANYETSEETSTVREVVEQTTEEGTNEEEEDEEANYETSEEMSTVREVVEQTTEGKRCRKKRRRQITGRVRRRVQSGRW
ncbi:hypothetical protein BSL78_28751 [Apostichopus japonicus]|uniref:Kazal-like domain-containing protein n=1 Tax=Stichopus japonicus TaxID=307972 RepID=A0A2G8JF99_STIJA|nr:hypothetical protein BSL78_28751 [Apostichopus japonicus]